MFCSKCGKEVQNEWSFCNYCGNALNSNENIQKEEIKKQEKYNNINSAKEVNQNTIGGVLFRALIYIGVVAIIFFSFKHYSSNNSINYDKRQMLSTIQNYSTTSITIDDFDIKKIENTNTYKIYEVTVYKSNYLISGSFYVALYSAYGRDSADTVFLNKSLSDLRDNLENY